MPGSDGQPVIPADSHVAVVHPDHNGGARMLRRGYNFVDGTNALGGLDAGLFFLAYVRDPDTHFIPMQTRMAAHDALMEYLKVTGSALFAVPPGTARASTSVRRCSPDTRLSPVWTVAAIPARPARGPTSDAVLPRKDPSR